MPGFKDFTSTTLASADVDSYLMAQSVIQCTSTTRPSSPHEGMMVYETDTNRYASYNGSAWEYLAGLSTGMIGLDLNAPRGDVLLTTTVPAASVNDLWWTGTVNDPSNLHTPGLAAWSLPVTGAWAFTVDLVFSNSWTRNGDFIRLKNWGTGGSIADRPVETSTGTPGASFAPVYLTSGTNVSVAIFQNSGSSRTLVSGVWSARWISA